MYRMCFCRSGCVSFSSPPFPCINQANDPAARATREETEEGKKVSRAGGKKFLCVFRRRPDAEVLAEVAPWWPKWEASAAEAEEEE